MSYICPLMSKLYPMIIDKNAVYSVSEASELTNLHPRLLRRLALSIKAKKIDNRYVFSGFQLIEYLKKKKKNVENYDDLKDELIELRQVKKEMSEHIQKMSDNVLTLSNDNQQLSKHITELTLKIELLQNDLANEKSKFKEVVTKEIPHQEILQIISEIDNDDYILIVLNAIKDNKHLEEFSEEEYQKFNDRLKEANFLENRIKEYKKEIARMEEYVLDYRNNIEYLKKSLDKRADETAIILKTIEQKNYIEAHDKGYDKK